MTLEQYADLQQFVPYHRTGRISTAFIASHLGVTPQHLRRLLKEEPPKKRLAWNKIDSGTRQFVADQKKSNPHYNCQWLSEIASDRLERTISRSSVYRILTKENLLSRIPVERKTRSRFEAEKSGDLVQMDTTWGYWLNGQRLCLILLLDDYSRYILSAKFVNHDTAEANMSLIRETVSKYGSFRLLYTDNASFFKPIRHNKSRYQNHKKSEYESEIYKSCRAAGITHIAHKPYEPQGKGKIERLFRFIQERFIEDQIINSNDLPISLAQQKLDLWVAWYNEKHVNRTTHKTPKERFQPNGFTPLPVDKCLDDIFCFKDTRKVDKCNEFSYQGVVYIIPSEKCMVAYTVQLHIQPERSIRVWHNDEFICELEIILKENRK